MDPTLAVIVLAAASGGIDLTNVLVGLLSGLAVVAASYITNRVAGRAQRDSAMLEWAKQLQASEQAARKEARESDDRAERIKDEADADVQRLRSQLDELHIQLQMATAATAKLTDTLISVASEVWRPEPDIPALRRLVGRPSAPGINGRAG
ncbi:hypothetical protein [Micromonospora tarensis]|uniref:Uncharacterized protein n=1 Tax=Micromonospora tarensis TaxID=2806100 RepID=A0ABS1YK46_9ACTN|nr:hypothetical protein [Micromonospora tarensis]MBM0277800.1 hypothetical protein [Micromonospora tarensis]